MASVLGWQVHNIVGKCTIDDKAEKTTDHDERNDEDVNHGVPPK